MVRQFPDDIWQDAGKTVETFNRLRSDPMFSGYADDLLRQLISDQALRERQAGMEQSRKADQLMHGLAIVCIAVVVYLVIMPIKGERPTVSPGSVDALFNSSIVKVRPSPEN
jgi:hypothetical protein